MTEENDRISQLLDKLEILLRKQESFSLEINELRHEISILTTASLNDNPKINTDVPVSESQEIKEQIITPVQRIHREHRSRQESTQKVVTKNRTPKIKSDIEKFIGENLINKIGIAITVIGVAIGAKYSIEHELISPLTRITLGYLAATGLLGFGIKLKKKYESYSAVLVSGTISIMYFLTYAAYSFYGLIPQVMAFALMVLFTAFAVVAALNYNKPVIAHIGLVGAYAVPFLLSDDSGKVGVLFSYMAIINIGILIIAFKKYWKSLNYSSFGFTWIIYFAWYASNYQPAIHAGLGLGFLTVFFIIFYLTYLTYKLSQKEKFESADICLILANSFIFYGLGYSILESFTGGSKFPGLFTLCNAIIHFIVSVVIYKKEFADRNLFYLTSGLALAFVTIAIPVQLDGNWVTLLWAGEAAVLFWIGRSKNVSFYEKLSYPLMVLAFLSIVQDWSVVYYRYNPKYPATRITPILNINFVSSLLSVSSFWFINILNQNKNYPSAFAGQKRFSFISFLIPAIFLATLYFSFRVEIDSYWNQLYADSVITIKTAGRDNPVYPITGDLMNFKIIWIINYSLIFLSILSFVNLKKIKNNQLGYINLALNVLTIAVFLIQGLYALSELRETYLQQTLPGYYKRGIFNIGIRYISYGFVALLIVSCYKYTREVFLKKEFKIAFDFLLHVTILWIVSSELITWMKIARSASSYKLGLSILWGFYSLLLIVLGIWKNKKHLRIGAIALFAITLVKLFFYDISHLNTIAKTIVFVSLGVLLLIISFLYNKYKHIISNEIKI